MALYITEELLKKLPDDVRNLIVEEGYTEEEWQKLKAEGEETPETFKKPVTPPEKSDMPMTPDEEAGMKVSDEMKMPKPQKYGEEDQYVDEFNEDGTMREYKESEKNKIKDFDDASERAFALTKFRDKFPVKEKPKVRPKKKVVKKEEENEAA